MKLSIIIPVFNIQKYISKCIESALNQNVTDYEILIIDDGSTDSTLQICREFENQDKKIVVIHQSTNQGVSVARNKGLEKAQGKWICFVDGDDELEPNSLLPLVETAEKINAEILIAQSFSYQDNQKVKENYQFDHNFEGKTFSGFDLIKKKAYKRGSVCGGIYCKHFLIKHDLKFPKGLKNGEDGIFMSLCYIYAKRIGFMARALYKVTIRKGSASRSWDFEKVKKQVDNIKFIKEYINQRPYLTENQIYILHYNIYGATSTAFNNLYYCFSVTNWIQLRHEIKKVLPSKIVTGTIPLQKGKISVLNFSLTVFGILVIISQHFRNLN